MIRSSTLHPPSQPFGGYLERLTDPLIESRFGISQPLPGFPNGLAGFLLIISQGHQGFNRLAGGPGSRPFRPGGRDILPGGRGVKIPQLVLQVEDDALSRLLPDAREAREKME